MFRKCVRLERKAVEYPRAVPLLTGLINAYRETGQEAGGVKVFVGCYTRKVQRGGDFSSMVRL